MGSGGQHTGPSVAHFSTFLSRPVPVPGTLGMHEGGHLVHEWRQMLYIPLYMAML